MTNMPIQTATISEIASVLGLSRQAVEYRAKKEEWEPKLVPGPGRNGQIKRFALTDISADIRLAFLSQVNPVEVAAQLITPEALAQVAETTGADKKDDAPPAYNRDSLWAAWEKATPKQRARANEALGILHMIEDLVASGGPRTRTVREVAKASGKNRATIYRWYGEVKGIAREDWLPALLTNSRAAGKPKAAFSDEAWEVFKADYLRPEKPTYSDCYRRVKDMAKAHGWQVPSLDTLKRRINREVDVTTVALLREGSPGLMKMLPAQRRTVRGMYATQWINGDGYKHNVFVKWPDGTVGRPKTWFWQDVYSRKVIAWRTDKSENKNTIRLAFGDVIRIGIPTDVTIDNTRAAANKWLTGGVPNRYRFKVKEEDPMGIIPTFGCKVHWTSVHDGHGHGQAKPVERQFGVGGIGEWVDKSPVFAGAYTGPDPMNKPDNYGETAIELEVFEAELKRCMTEYNARKGRRTETGCGVYSFNEVFNESYAKVAIRKATDAQFRMCLMAAESVRIGKDGSFTLDAGSAVGVGANRYSGKTNVLYRYTGSRVVVRFDPAKLHEDVWVYDANGQMLCEAKCMHDAGFGDTDASTRHNRNRNAKIKAENRAAELAKRMTIEEVADKLVKAGSEDGEMPEPGMTEGMFGLPSMPEQKQPTRRPMAVNADYVPDDDGEDLNVDDILIGQMGNMRRVIRERSEKV